MHQLGIVDEVRERVILRRGSVAVFDCLSPRRTAHIVVDLQNGFMAPGQVAEVPVARASAKARLIAGASGRLCRTHGWRPLPYKF
jgi:hypothetical protein